MKQLKWFFDEWEINKVFDDYENGVYPSVIIHSRSKNNNGDYYTLIENRGWRRCVSKEVYEDVDGVLPLEDLEKRSFSRCYTRRGLNELMEESDIFIEKRRSCYDYFTSNNIIPIGPYYEFDGQFIDDLEHNGDKIVGNLKDYGISYLIIPRFMR